MEIIKTRYQRLCEVSILHHLFLDEGNTVFDNLSPIEQAKRLSRYDARTWLDVVPDENTDKTFCNFGFLLKPSAGGFYLLIETRAADTPKQPLTNIKLGLKLLFKKNTGAQTALPLNVINGAPAIYAFGNEISFLNAGVFPALALVPELYNNSRLYRFGDIVQDNTNKQYMALNKPGNQGVSLTNTGFWRELPANVRYASASNSRAAATESERQGFGLIELSTRTDLTNYRLLEASGNIRNPAPVFDLRINKL